MSPEMASHRPAGHTRVLGAMVAAVAGCGPAAPAGSGPAGSPGGTVPAHLALCADPGAVSQVEIARIPPLSQLQGPPKLRWKAITIRVTDPARARDLGRAVCAAPTMPSGTFHCPLNRGGGVQVSFTASGRRLPVVQIQGTGCERITGAGPVRWVARTPGFWMTLERVSGIPGMAHTP
jgi:hypothetical protein